LLTVSLVHIVTQWSGSGGTEAYQWPTGSLQCFDAVGWVIWPVKIVPEMNYKVSSGTLNSAHSLTHYAMGNGRCRYCKRVNEIFDRINAGLEFFSTYFAYTCPCGVVICVSCLVENLMV